MIDSVDAAAQISEKSIMEVLFSMVVGDGNPAQALCLKELSEDVFEHIDLETESIEVLRSGFRTAVGAPPFKEPTLCFLLDLGRWQVGECQEVVALEVSAFLHELLTTLVIDDARNGIGKCTLLGITGCA